MYIELTYDPLPLPPGGIGVGGHDSSTASPPPPPVLALELCMYLCRGRKRKTKCRFPFRLYCGYGLAFCVQCASAVRHTADIELKPAAGKGEGNAMRVVTRRGEALDWLEKKRRVMTRVAV